LAFLFGIALVALGCATGSDDATPRASATSGGASASPVVDASTIPAEATPTPAETDPPSTDPAPTDPAPTETPPIAETPPPGGSGAADGCAGTAENRDFYAAVAAGVGWSVYCPVLGAGWFVDAGQYRLAGGGRMTISYRGPGGAGFELGQGYVCGDGACQPSGSDLGEAAYGDRTGTMYDLGDGRYAILVDADGAPSWTLAASGSSEAEVRVIAADLLHVSD
jgi:hypothetical protein